MPITTIQGTGGAFAGPAGFNAKFQSWSATFEGREFNTTGFGDKGWITGKIINGRVSGNAVGVIAAGTPVPATACAATFGAAAMEGNVTLTFADGKTWAFAALVSAVAVDRAEEGAGSSVYRLTFASSGPVTQTW